MPRDDAPVFTGAPLAAPLEVICPVSIRLSVRGPTAARLGIAWRMMAVMMEDATTAQNQTAARTAFRYAVTAATAVAAGRVGLGLVALAWPAVPARPWVGASADDLAARVFGRALGARDLALGLGALAALRQSRPAWASGLAPAAPAAPAASAASAGWLAAGALSDALDVVATATAWPELPSRTRWLVAASAGGAALGGVAGAIALLLGQRR